MILATTRKLNKHSFNTLGTLIQGPTFKLKLFVSCDADPLLPSHTLRLNTLALAGFCSSSNDLATNTYSWLEEMSKSSV